jgi:hypothetical protein
MLYPYLQAYSVYIDRDNKRNPILGTTITLINLVTLVALLKEVKDVLRAILIRNKGLNKEGL